MPFDEQLALYIFAIWEVDYYRYFCDRYKEISMHVPEFFQFSAMTFDDEKYQTKGQQLKFEYTKLWTKTSLSAKPINDLNRFRTFNCDAAFLQRLDTYIYVGQNSICNVI